MSNVGRTKASAILRQLQDAGQIEISDRSIRVIAPDERLAGAVSVSVASILICHSL